MLHVMDTCIVCNTSENKDALGTVKRRLMLRIMDTCIACSTSENKDALGVNATTCAAYGGQLHCLQYLREQGCPWNETATEFIVRIAEKILSADGLDIYLTLLCDLVHCQAPGYLRILDMPLYVEYCNASSPWLK